MGRISFTLVLLCLALFLGACSHQRLGYGKDHSVKRSHHHGHAYGHRKHNPGRKKGH